MLNRFSDNEWSPGDRQAPGDQRAIGELPPITGLSSNVPTKEYDYDVNIGQNFDSPWLPTQFPISAIDAPGDWRYDSSTMDFMSFDEDLRAGGMSYDMTAVEPELDPEAMNTSPPGQRHDGYPAHRAAAGPLHVGPHPGDPRDGRLHRTVPEGRRPAELLPRQRPY